MDVCDVNVTDEDDFLSHSMKIIAPSWRNVSGSNAWSASLRFTVPQHDDHSTKHPHEGTYLNQSRDKRVCNSLSRSMMIVAQNVLMKKLIYINRVPHHERTYLDQSRDQRDYVSALHQDTDAQNISILEFRQCECATRASVTIMEMMTLCPARWRLSVHHSREGANLDHARLYFSLMSTRRHPKVQKNVCVVHNCKNLCVCVCAKKKCVCVRQTSESLSCCIVAMLHRQRSASIQISMCLFFFCQK